MVTNPSSGLRFDIYERIQLSDEVAGIRQFDEIELVPQIEFITQNDQAVLKGNLLLTGTYIGSDETRSNQSLEHSIPVEITLPMNRIHDVEDIGVEIENFDVDVLSSHNLNVTGVLSLRGIEMQTSDNEQWKSDEEDIVFVHQANERANNSPDRQPKREADEPPKKVIEDRVTPQLVDIRAGTEETEAKEAEVAKEEAIEAKEVVRVAQVSKASEEIEADERDSDERDPDERDAADTESDAEQAEVKTGQNEMKIAFSSKNMFPETGSKRQSGTADPGVDEKEDQKDSLLAEKKNAAMANSTTDQNKTRDQNAANDAADNAGSADTESSNEMEWKSLFLNREENEELKFSKMRMCIVQKRETIDTIAERYSLNRNEIVLYNQLGDQDVSEGQIIYIPS